MRIWVALAVALTLLAAMGGCAKKNGYASMDEVYMKYDTNKDGVISKDEFVAKWKNKQKAETAWKSIDKKNNGFVDRTLNNDTPLNVWSAVESNDDPY